MVDDRVDEILVVDTATVDELFDVTIVDFDEVVENVGKLFAEEDDAFVVVVDFFVVDVGALSTRRRWKSIQKLNTVMEAKRFMAAGMPF